MCKKECTLCNRRCHIWKTQWVYVINHEIALSQPLKVHLIYELSVSLSLYLHQHQYFFPLNYPLVYRAINPNLCDHKKSLKYYHILLTIVLYYCGGFNSQVSQEIRSRVYILDKLVHYSVEIERDLPVCALQIIIIWWLLIVVLGVNNYNFWSVSRYFRVSIARWCSWCSHILLCSWIIIRDFLSFNNLIQSTVTCCIGWR